MRRRTVLAAAGAWGVSGLVPVKAAEPVDLLLVLAVDASRSIDEEEARLQREGYRSAMTDPTVVAAIKGGIIGAIAVTYFEWARYDFQQTILPWTRIAGAEDAAAWSARLGSAPRNSLAWTSISGALAFSRQVLAQSPYEGTRQVVDVSGDGANNNGPSPEDERDQLVAKGVTINGLPITGHRRNWGMPPEANLESAYRNTVIGGPGAFLITANDFDAFAQAIKQKLLQEIA